MFEAFRGLLFIHANAKTWPVSHIKISVYSERQWSTSLRVVRLKIRIAYVYGIFFERFVASRETHPRQYVDAARLAGAS